MRSIILFWSVAEGESIKRYARDKLVGDIECMRMSTAVAAVATVAEPVRERLLSSSSSTSIALGLP